MVQISGVACVAALLSNNGKALSEQWNIIIISQIVHFLTKQYSISLWWLLFLYHILAFSLFSVVRLFFKDGLALVLYQKKRFCNTKQSEIPSGHRQGKKRRNKKADNTCKWSKIWKRSCMKLKMWTSLYTSLTFRISVIACPIGCVVSRHFRSKVRRFLIIMLKGYVQNFAPKTRTSGCQGVEYHHLALIEQTEFWLCWRCVRRLYLPTLSTQAKNSGRVLFVAGLLRDIKSWAFRIGAPIFLNTKKYMPQL